MTHEMAESFAVYEEWATIVTTPKGRNPPSTTRERARTLGHVGLGWDFLVRLINRGWPLVWQQYETDLVEMFTSRNVAPPQIPSRPRGMPFQHNP